MVIEGLVTPGSFSDLTQKVSQAIPQPVNQTIQQSIQTVKSVAPQVRQEVKTYTKSYNPTLHHLIFLGYFLGLFLLNNFTYLTNWSNLIHLNFWWFLVKDFFGWFCGGFLGWNLLFLDNIVYVYLTHPETNVRQQARNIFQQKGLWGWFKFMASLALKEKPSLRSALFQIAWVFLAFFTVTSTVSWFGKGIVLALGLHLLLDQWQWQQKSPQDLNRQLFWQIKRPVSLEEQKNYLLIISASFLLLTVLI